jgi:predicted ArsR family transcriptional regulator
MELQETRRHILSILKDRGEATVEDLVEGLADRMKREMTSVTVRHHLERLRQEGLIEAPQIRRRSSPGRPQYSYSLSPKAMDYFPNNYAGLAGGLLQQIKSQLPPQQVNVIMEGMAESMATAAGIPQHVSLRSRLQYVVEYLNEHGYVAEWHSTDEGFMLSTTNCPYERLAGSHEELCGFDLKLVSSLLGVVPRFVGRLRDGDPACQYFIPQAS